MRLKAYEIVTNKAIPIVPYCQTPKYGLTLKPMCHLIFPCTLPPILNLDLVWHMNWMCRDDNHARPNWSRYMQHVSNGDHHGSAVLTMLPLIDLNPSDET